MIGGGGEAYSTDPDEKSRREEGVDLRFVIPRRSRSKSFFSRDDKDVVRYSCSQPPDLIPRQLDLELEEVPCRQCLHSNLTSLKFNTF